jgi:hypothetical protein
MSTEPPSREKLQMRDSPQHSIATQQVPSSEDFARAGLVTYWTSIQQQNPRLDFDPAAKSQAAKSRPKAVPDQFDASAVSPGLMVRSRNLGSTQIWCLVRGVSNMAS